MKALVKSKAEKGIWLADVPEPECGVHDVLIRVKKTGICGTDIHIYNWDEWAQKTVPVGITTGHEFVGEIVEVGSAVYGYSVGERVSAEGHITCGLCRNCQAGRRHLCAKTIGVGVNRNGAFAEYVSVPASNIWRCDPAIDDDTYAIFDPLGNAAHTALSFPMVGEDVLIAGAGPIGLMAIPMAKAAGARKVVITDINESRLEVARKLGATRAVNVAKENLSDVMTQLGMKEGFDVALEMSGSPAALGSIVETLAHGGKIAMLGIVPDGTGLDWSKVVFKGLSIKGIYGREIFETWYKLTALLHCGMDISPVITHRFSYKDYAEAFEIMAGGKSGKIVLDWG